MSAPTTNAPVVPAGFTTPAPGAVYLEPHQLGWKARPDLGSGVYELPDGMLHAFPPGQPRVVAYMADLPGVASVKDSDADLRQRVRDLEAENAKLRASVDGAYLERNQVVAGLAALAWRLGWPVGTARTVIEGWDPEWHSCVYIDLPTGQVSWHYHDREAPLFAFLPTYTGAWDGHDTPEKYRRVLDLHDRGVSLGEMPHEPSPAVTDSALLHAAQTYRAFWSHGPSYMDLWHAFRRVRDLSLGVVKPDEAYAPLRGEAVPKLASGPAAPVEG